MVLSCFDMLRISAWEGVLHPLEAVAEGSEGPAARGGVESRSPATSAATSALALAMAGGGLFVTQSPKQTVFLRVLFLRAESHASFTFASTSSSAVAAAGLAGEVLAEASPDGAGGDTAVASWTLFRGASALPPPRHEVSSAVLGDGDFCVFAFTRDAPPPRLFALKGLTRAAGAPSPPDLARLCAMTFRILGLGGWKHAMSSASPNDEADPDATLDFFPLLGPPCARLGPRRECKTKKSRGSERVRAEGS